MLSKGKGIIFFKFLLKGESMKTIFQAFAKYNQSVNWSILELVESLTQEKIMAKTKAFFPSIYETMNHNLLSDLFWLKRFGDGFKDSTSLNSSELVSLDFKVLRKEFEDDFTKLFRYRKQVDEAILYFIEELDGNKLTSVFKYKNYKGEDMENILWKIFLQWFNHQTHHRGQISVLLDMIDVKNDYSSMINRI
jgi:uncharacterized damage-inducible protein DinB